MFTGKVSNILTIRTIRPVSAISISGGKRAKIRSWTGKDVMAVGPTIGKSLRSRSYEHNVNDDKCNDSIFRL